MPLTAIDSLRPHTREVSSAPVKTVLVVLSLLVVFATALPLLRFDQWWIRAFDFPRAQISIIGIVLLVFYICFWDTRKVYESFVLGLLVLAVGYQAVKMSPYTVLMPKQILAAESPTHDARLSLLVANVLMDNRKPEAFLDVVHRYDPDVILTLETDQWWEEALRTLEAYPHPLQKPLQNAYGRLVHSRLEVDPTWGSDHFPVFIELSLEAGAEAEQKEPSTNRSEGQEVDGKIEDG